MTISDGSKALYTNPSALGTGAAEVYSSLILQQREIQNVYWSRLKIPIPFSDRIQSSARLRVQIQRALKLKEFGIPFLEAFFIDAMRNGVVNTDIVNAALSHQRTDINLYPLSREELQSGALQRLPDNATHDAIIVLSSEVRMTSGQVLHLPMLDFRCDVSRDNLDSVVLVCKRLIPGGAVILESGNSYHACGLKPVTIDELITILAQALFFNPIVDRAYIAHQIIDRRCCLRISIKGEQKNVPFLVAWA